MQRAKAAAELGAFLWDHKGETFSVEELVDQTGLSPAQISAGEAELKRLVARSDERFAGWTFHVAVGNESAHGFIQDSEVTLTDQVRRAKYMYTRAASELAMTMQAAARVEDPNVAAYLRRATVQSKAAAASLDAAFEIMLDSVGVDA